MNANDIEHRFYAKQRYEQALENCDFYPSIKWTTAGNPSVCEFARGLHGKQFATTDPLWPRCLPPIHQGCACVIWPQMEDRVRDIERLADYFDKGE